MSYYSSDNPMHEETRFTHEGHEYIIVFAWRDQPLGLSIDGEMRYFRITHNDNYIWRANKTCISSCGTYRLFGWLSDRATKDEEGKEEAALCIREAFFHVRPSKHQIACDAYLEAFPYLRNTVA